MGKPSHYKGRNPMKEKKEFDEEVIQIDRVTRVVKGGRRLRFRATVVIGDRKGRVGIGIGKSNEVAAAIQKAIQKAKRSIIRVPIFRDTIPHDIKLKYKASRLLMLPAGEGTGIIAGGAVRKVVELAGIKNILSKSFGTNNRVSNTQCAYKALGLLRKRHDNRKPKKEEKKPQDFPEIVNRASDKRAPENDGKKAKTEPNKAVEENVAKDSK
jgi:small subunit ribosomal protein S5